MRKSVIAIAAALALAISPTFATAATTKAAVKIGAKCAKSGATSKVGSTNVICKTNSKKVLVWTKADSAECVEAKANYATQLKTYNDIVSKVADAKKAAATLTGADADTLKAKIAETEATLPSLKSLVDQLSLLTTQICKLG